MARLGYIAVGNIQISAEHLPEWEQLNNDAHELSLKGKAISRDIRYRMLILEGVKEAHAKIISESSDKAALRADAGPTRRRLKRLRSKEFLRSKYISYARFSIAAPPIKIEDLQLLTTEMENLTAWISSCGSYSVGHFATPSYTTLARRVHRTSERAIQHAEAVLVGG